MTFEQACHKNYDCLEIICILNQGKKKYCIWFSDEEGDSFLMIDYALKIFSSQKDALTFLSAFLNYEKTIKTSTMDVDGIRQMIGFRAPFNSCAALTFWNMASDLAASTGRPYRGDAKDTLTNCVYDKLFYGNNLPAINTSSLIYVPRFSSEEYTRLQSVLMDAIALVERIIAFDL